MIEGIDISHHQTRTPPLGTSLGFVICRATYGTYPDDRFALHAANVRSAGKVLGAYHFGRYGDPAAQARAFLHVIGDVKLVALDYEKDGDNRHMTPDQARLFIRAVQATGRRCGLYASDSGFPALGQDWNWVANWSERPTRPWAIWQYAVTGTPRIDRDRFDGTAEQLRALAGLDIPDTSTGETMSIYAQQPVSGTFTTVKGDPIRGWKPTASGWEVARTWTPSGNYAGSYDARLVRLSGAAVPSSLVHVSSGTLDGYYVSTADLVNETDTPEPADPSPYTEADIDAAIAADRAKARVTWE